MYREKREGRRTRNPERNIHRTSREDCINKIHKGRAAEIYTVGWVDLYCKQKPDFQMWPEKGAFLLVFKVLFFKKSQKA